MLPRGSYFSGQARDEKILLFIRRHWMSFLPWIIFLSLMVFVPMILIIVFGVRISVLLQGSDKVYTIIGSSAYMLIILAIFLTAWTDYYLDVTILTPEHLVDIHQTGLFNRKIAEQSLLRVQDVSARMKGILQTFFRYGTVFVETAGEAPNFEMQNIPNPNRVANTILKLHEELVAMAGYEERDLSSGVGLEQPVNNPKPTSSADNIVQYLEKTKPANQPANPHSTPSHPPFEKPLVKQPIQQPLKQKKLSKEGELEEGESIKI